MLNPNQSRQLRRLSWACAKEVNPPALSGMATSVVNVGAFLGTAIMQPLVGWAIDHAHAGAGNTPLVWTTIGRVSPS